MRLFPLVSALFLALLPAAAVPQLVPIPPPPGPSPEQQQRLEDALERLPRGKEGTIEAFVVSIALDGDPVFAREAREAADVLRRRFRADNRVLVLAGPDGTRPSDLPHGSPTALRVALARIAELINQNEDVLVLYATSHGIPAGIAYDYGPEGRALVTPPQLAQALAGIDDRLLIVSACYSGAFIPHLRGDRSIVITAATADRPSFGCTADNDWTFFGDAMINHAMRRPQPLGAAFGEARQLVEQWEKQVGVPPSRPQIYIGPGAARWLAPLERRMPTAATRPVGRRSVDSGAVPAGR